MKEFIIDIESNYLSIKEEFEFAVSDKDFICWNEKKIYNHGWNVFGLRFKDKDIIHYD
jgi:hypothetical protein